MVKNKKKRNSLRLKRIKIGKMKGIFAGCKKPDSNQNVDSNTCVCTCEPPPAE